MEWGGEGDGWVDGGGWPGVTAVRVVGKAAVGGLKRCGWVDGLMQKKANA